MHAILRNLKRLADVACLLRWKDGVGKFGWNDLPESSVLLFALMGPGINVL